MTHSIPFFWEGNKKIWGKLLYLYFDLYFESAKLVKQVYYIVHV